MIDASFESRVCNLVKSLINNVNSTRIIDSLNENNDLIIRNDPFFEINNEHEGKTLLHLCAEMGFYSLYTNLINLRTQLLLNKSDCMSSFKMSNLIINELDLVKSDHNQNAPIVLYIIFYIILLIIFYRNLSLLKRY
jgi:hypothetical protein